MSDIVERRKLSENHACWDCDFADELIAEIGRLRAEIELLHAELRVTKKLGLAALQDAMRQAGTGEEW